MAFHCYIFTSAYPERLYFRDSVVALEIVRKDGLHREVIALQARKVETGGTAIELARTEHGRDHIDVALYREGFVLNADTPEARLMERLVHHGFAQRRPRLGCVL